MVNRRHLCAQIFGAGLFAPTIIHAQNTSLTSKKPSLQPYYPPAKLKNYEKVAGLGGKDVNIFKTHLGKNLLINFWAIWCEPCLRELPQFNQLATNPPVDNFRIITINIDQSQSISDNYLVNRLKLGNFKYNYGMGQGLMRQLGFESLPTSLFVHKNGQIKGYAVGIQEWLSDDWQQIFKRIYN